MDYSKWYQALILYNQLWQSAERRLYDFPLLLS